MQFRRRAHFAFTVFILIGLGAGTLSTAAAAADAPGNAASNPQTIDYMINGGFEHSFQGWQTSDIGIEYGRWYATNLNFGFSSQVRPLPLAYEGSFQAECDEMYSSAHFLYQDVGSNGDCAALTLKLTLWVINQVVVNGVAQYASPNSFALVPGVPNQQVRVDIMDPTAPIDDMGAGVWKNLFHTSPGDPAAFPYTTLTADMTPWNGKMVRLRIAEVNNLGTLDVGVDAASYVCERPTPAASATWGEVKGIYR
jgi:hypothetical protein